MNPSLDSIMGIAGPLISKLMEVVGPLLEKLIDGFMNFLSKGQDKSFEWARNQQDATNRQADSAVELLAGSEKAPQAKPEFFGTRAA